MNFYFLISHIFNKYTFQLISLAQTKLPPILIYMYLSLIIYYNYFLGNNLFEVVYPRQYPHPTASNNPTAWPFTLDLDGKRKNCICPLGFKGEMCNEEIGCEMINCLNGGSCISSTSNSNAANYTCLLVDLVLIGVSLFVVDSMLLICFNSFWKFSFYLKLYLNNCSRFHDFKKW